MDDDWDLHAVVRGCAAATTTTTDTTTTTTTNNPFPSFTPNFHEDHQDSFDFPGLIDDRNDPFQGLQEIYQEFCLDAPPPATTSSAGVDTATVPVLAAQVFQPHREIVQIQPPLLQMNMQSQESIQFKNPTLASPSHHSFPAANPQPIRQRRRKNQQMKMVRQMTQEELSADSWAWRKYGQKPIKGSPYPRNYYRCSTSKGCAARKQVERSPNDEGIFVVSYTGEHTHPRPAHRSSLAGSTRSKFAAASKSNNIENNAHLFQKGSVSSSSTASGSSFSPCSPLMEGEAAAQNDDVEMAEEEDGGGDEDDENVIVIPNDLMNDDEDMFKGFQDSDHSSGGGTCFQVACYHHRRGRPPAQPLTLPTSTAEEEADQSPEKMG